MNAHGICFWAIVTFLAIGQVSSLKKCPSPLGKFLSASVSGCTKEPCIIKRGSNMTLTVSFQALADVNNVTDDVQGIIGEVPIPFPTKHPNACTTKGITCPLKTGSTYTYTAMTPVSKLYPVLRLVVQWAIKDENGNFVFCVRIPAKIE